MFSLTRYLLRKGDAARDARDWPAAQRAYSRALRLNPSLAYIWVQYGHALSETDNYLMQPLRLERVQHKLEEILRTFPGKVHVSVPVTTRNRDEAGAIRDWFMERGARLVVFDPISSRCAEDRTLFGSLALNPHPIRCSPVIMDDLIVDCDGQVLICCLDFRRVEGIGSLATHSFADILVGVHRETTRKLLAENCHEELATCRSCYADLRGEFVPACN